MRAFLTFPGRNASEKMLKQIFGFITKINNFVVALLREQKPLKEANKHQEEISTLGI